jgi:hypothetical protein
VLLWWCGVVTHSIAEVLYNIDTAIQFGEDAEVKVRCSTQYR